MYNGLDSDYEMNPSDWAVQQPQIEEMMDDARSDVMVVSEAGDPVLKTDGQAQNDSLIEEAGLPIADADIFIADEQHPSEAIVGQPASSLAVTGSIATRDPEDESAVSRKVVDHSVTPTPEQDRVQEHTSRAGRANMAPAKADAGLETDTTGIANIPNQASHKVEDEVQESDELEEVAHELDSPAPDPTNSGLVSGSAPAGATASYPDHTDEAEESEDLEYEDEGQGQGQGDDDYHATGDEHGPDVVRVIFNGQDFVIWSTADIPAFYAARETAATGAGDGGATTSSESSHEASQSGAEVEQVQAPALSVSEDVLWQPLDNLFVGLREKDALGDFLEDSSELHLSFPDLGLEVHEDNVYCREITLDDLVQLHHGLGHATSLQIVVSECPRFITKYNELAHHVSKMLAKRLDSSDDEQQEAQLGPSAPEVQHQATGSSFAAISEVSAHEPALSTESSAKDSDISKGRAAPPVQQCDIVEQGHDGEVTGDAVEHGGEELDDVRHSAAQSTPMQSAREGSDHAGGSDESAAVWLDALAHESEYEQIPLSDAERNIEEHNGGTDFQAGADLEQTFFTVHEDDMSHTLEHDQYAEEDELEDHHGLDEAELGMMGASRADAAINEAAVWTHEAEGGKVPESRDGHIRGGRDAGDGYQQDEEEEDFEQPYDDDHEDEEESRVQGTRGQHQKQSTARNEQKVKDVEDGADEGDYEEALAETDQDYGEDGDEADRFQDDDDEEEQILEYTEAAEGAETYEFHADEDEELETSRKRGFEDHGGEDEIGHLPLDEIETKRPKID
ncbi:hypothetical protein BCV70DRAFT_215604 [Testicularia cyperi]|uniref:Uncharacterized protein n=1 Tax=Testicularia cyperi TaxID=1882483 RepID=A0A317XY00_9BASI|nr:hypothetical protein BCV70DRAFT_215604 [Testicularia cyperi]